MCSEKSSGVTALDELSSLPPEELNDVLDAVLVRLRRMRNDEEQARIIIDSEARRSRCYPKRRRKQRSSRPAVDDDDDEVAAAASVRTVAARNDGGEGVAEELPPTSGRRPRRRNSVHTTDISRRLHHEEEGSLPKGRRRRGSEGSVYSLDEGLDKNKKAPKNKRGILLAPRYSSSTSFYSSSSDSNAPHRSGGDGTIASPKNRQLKRSNNSSRILRIETRRNEVVRYAPARPPAESAVEEVEWHSDDNDDDCYTSTTIPKPNSNNADLGLLLSSSFAILLPEEEVTTTDAPPGGLQYLARLCGALLLTAAALAKAMQLMDGECGGVCKAVSLSSMLAVIAGSASL